MNARGIPVKKGTHGEPLYRKCDCGKWIERKTGEHVEIESLTWEEVKERYLKKCPRK